MIIEGEGLKKAKGQVYAFSLMIKGGEILVLSPKPGCQDVSAWRFGRAFMLVLFLAALFLVVLGLPAIAAGTPVDVPVAVPKGYVDFCKRYPGECIGTTAFPQKVKFTVERMAELERVQREVNEKIFYVPDTRNYGKSDYWDFPYIYGDCEDYALEKRKRLIALGWPRSALLLDIVRLANGKTHLILDVVADRGEIILDNLFRHPRSWQGLGYRRIMRQSPYAEAVWLAPRTYTPATQDIETTSGVNRTNAYPFDSTARR